MYVKITNNNETHNGFIYHDGLNELLEPFNSDPAQSCVSGGLYFTDIMNAHKYYNYGIYIRIISLPQDDPYFKIIKDPSGDKFRANKIILGERYPLCDPNTYKVLNIKMPSINFLIECAVKEGNIDCLGILRKLYFVNDDEIESFCEQIYYTGALEGNIDMLQRVYNICPILATSSTSIINNAARRGNLNVLNWANSKGCLGDEKIYIYAIRNNHYSVIKWADEHNYKCNKKTICTHANDKTDEKILKWLEQKDTTRNMLRYDNIITRTDKLKFC